MNETEYQKVVNEIRTIDRRLKCLASCFAVIQQENVLDTAYSNMLSLRRRRKKLLERAKMLYSNQTALGK